MKAAKSVRRSPFTVHRSPFTVHRRSQDTGKSATEARLPFQRETLHLRMLRPICCTAAAANGERRTANGER
jgi:hypothetical protein